MKVKINKGEIYIAADGMKAGHLVVDQESYKYCDDVVTIPFTAQGIIPHISPNRIDNFKLACVRYSLCNDLPEWVPEEIIKIRKTMAKI